MYECEREKKNQREKKASSNWNSEKSRLYREKKRERERERNNRISIHRFPNRYQNPNVFRLWMHCSSPLALVSLLVRSVAQSPISYRNTPTLRWNTHQMWKIFTRVEKCILSPIIETAYIYSRFCALALSSCRAHMHILYYISKALNISMHIYSHNSSGTVHYALLLHRRLRTFQLNALCQSFVAFYWYRFNNASRFSILCSNRLLILL